MEYLIVLYNEVYKILFLLIPILVSVAMIVGLIEEFGVLFKSEKGQM